jgi:hypothetical protein
MWGGKKLMILKKEHREYKFKSIDKAQIINKLSKMNRSRELKFDSDNFLLNFTYFAVYTLISTVNVNITKLIAFI